MNQPKPPQKTQQTLEKQEKNLSRYQRKEELLVWLSMHSEKMALKEDFIQQLSDKSDEQAFLYGGNFIVFEYKGQTWVQNPADHTPEMAELIEADATQRVNAAWQACAALCGTLTRPGASHAKTPRLFVVARTYTEETAAKRLQFHVGVIKDALKKNILPSFVDPEQHVRIPAAAVEAALNDEAQWEKVADCAVLRIRDICQVGRLAYMSVRGRLKKAGYPLEPTWGQVKGQWGLPATYRAFRAAQASFAPPTPAPAAPAPDARPTGHTLREKSREARRKEREEQDSLRQQLFEIFPSWDSINRAEQHITLHLGPTNSGKTYQGISELVKAGSGWYLAPLRLLAHEVFDTLNKNGTRCNLLTGEESITVEGAHITAATIEMFESQHSGACVIIDEAHMLSDTQRGWAWTRAIMETRAADIHIIGAPVVEPLIKQLASEIGIALEVENYQRLTPLEVADTPWSLATLPEKTILVAFSRKVVLALKTELEQIYHRKVSVVYGNLPPEVRLNQAERFAKGETELCVATDAIGMGLNLPADNVCFYETSKYDGKEMRQLTANEIRQIGGRAGRYGLSERGLIGALNKTDLGIIRFATHASLPEIGFAHVSPNNQAIALMPGELSEKLQKWVDLAGIPPRWKELLRPMDLSSQIELARMLTPKDVKKIGDEVALQLINAPCYRDTQTYWYRCALAVINNQIMPNVIDPPKVILSAKDLESYEVAIRSADIYLWLSQRERFAPHAPNGKQVRKRRYAWALEVDSALQKQVDTTRRCKKCGRALPTNYRFGVCNNCFREQRYGPATDW